jgi:hypothetical protein
MARRLAILVAVIALSLVACSGNSAVGQTNAPGPTSGTGGGPTGGPNATPGGAGGGVFDPCAQLTVDEAAGAMGTDPLSAEPTTGDPATCRYKLGGGEEALVVDYLANGASAQFQAYIDNGSAEPVSGVGDRALYESGTRRLVFMAGEQFVVVYPRYVNATNDALVAATAMGKIIAARMTTGSIPPGLQITAPPAISADDACDLLSGDEAAGVMAKGPMKAEGNPATPQFCTYSLASTSEVLFTVYLDAKGGRSAWDMFAGSLVTEPVSGLGEQAMFEPSTGILFALKGDSVLNVNVYGSSPQESLDLDRRLMEIMLGHL